MEVSRILFHPFHESHSTQEIIQSVILNIFLSIATIGIYPVVFVGVHLWNWCYIDSASLHAPLSQNQPTPQNRVIPQNGAIPWSHKSRFAISPLTLQTRELLSRTEFQDHLIAIQADYLQALEEDISQNIWKNLRSHGSFGFDWWLLPTDKTSASYGNIYCLTSADVIHLKKHPEYMRNYYRIIEILTQSWGWDMRGDPPKLLSKNSQQYWAKYPVRLGKLIDSLRLFEEENLLQRLFTCIHLAGGAQTLGLDKEHTGYYNQAIARNQ